MFGNAVVIVSLVSGIAPGWWIGGVAVAGVVAAVVVAVALSGGTSTEPSLSAPTVVF